MQARGAFSRLIRTLRRDTAGSVVIETAIVAPVLVLLSLGTFDISRMIARQHELDTAGIDVQGIILAVASGSGTSLSAIKSVIVSSLNVSSDKVTVEQVYRCGTTNSLHTNANVCGGGDKQSTYIRVTITDKVTPFWTNFGIGQAMNLKVVRTVQVS